jgi:hypothetical protein
VRSRLDHLGGLVERAEAVLKQSRSRFVGIRRSQLGLVSSGSVLVAAPSWDGQSGTRTLDLLRVKQAL